jgi:hypothetical protein
VQEEWEREKAETLLFFDIIYIYIHKYYLPSLLALLSQGSSGVRPSATRAHGCERRKEVQEGSPGVKEGRMVGKTCHCNALPPWPQLTVRTTKRREQEGAIRQTARPRERTASCRYLHCSNNSTSGEYGCRAVPLSCLPVRIAGHANVILRSYCPQPLYKETLPA